MLAYDASAGRAVMIARSPNTSPSLRTWKGSSSSSVLKTPISPAATKYMVMVWVPSGTTMSSAGDDTGSSTASSFCENRTSLISSRKGTLASSLPEGCSSCQGSWFSRTSSRSSPSVGSNGFENLVMPAASLLVLWSLLCCISSDLRKFFSLVSLSSLAAAASMDEFEATGKVAKSWNDSHIVMPSSHSSYEIVPVPVVSTSAIISFAHCLMLASIFAVSSSGLPASEPSREPMPVLPILMDSFGIISIRPSTFSRSSWPSSPSSSKSKMQKMRCAFERTVARWEKLLNRSSSSSSSRSPEPFTSKMRTILCVKGL